MLERWARPLRGLWNGIANVMGGFYRVLGGPGKLLQDFLNGAWLGHPLHPVLTDVVIGAGTAALLLDLLRLLGVTGLETATTWVVGLAWLSGLATIVTGLTDFKDTGPGSDARNVAGLHGVTNIIAIIGFTVSLFVRLGGGYGAGFVWLLVSYLILSTGSYIGGHIVFKHGEMVNHNAFARGKRAKEFTPVMPATELAEATPTKAMLGTTALVLVRRGDVVHALKESCSHAGGPLSKGTLGDGTIQCPWHGSVFSLTDGAVRHGPATSRQVSYEARVNEGQVEVLGPFD